MTRNLLLLGLLPLLLSGKGFEAGVARVDITPTAPMWLSGYASRTHASEGVLTPLAAKALALSDGRTRVVLVTMDLIGFPRSMADSVAAAVAREHGLDRASLFFNASHTHTGPMVEGYLPMLFELAPEELRLNRDYRARVERELVTLIGAALGKLAPARLEYGVGSAGFARYRRRWTGAGERPGDHSVPVLRVRDAAGRELAILFGYACHNTTLTGEHYRFSGDYAGFAQLEIEKAHPGATALFVALCGGDQNPDPRGSEELGRQHGVTLAAAVADALRRRMEPVKPRLKSVFHQTDLAFAGRTRQDYEKELSSSVAAVRRRAALMLKDQDSRLVRKLPYPVQAIRFSKKGPVLLGLGGEVVSEYALRARREFPGERLIVAGYSNDVPCYIPSLRMLREGGYEAVDSMAYYGQPGPFDETVEETVFAAIRQVMGRVKP
jgi:hypothetical protein